MVTLTPYRLDIQWNFILRLVLDVMQVIINASLCLCLAFSHSLSLQERVVQAQTKFLCEDIENSTFNSKTSICHIHIRGKHEYYQTTTSSVDSAEDAEKIRTYGPRSAASEHGTITLRSELAKTGNG